MLMFEDAGELAEVVQRVKVLPPAKRKTLLRSLRQETGAGGSSK